MHIEITTQPDDETCGPTSLHAVYRYYGDAISLEQTVAEVERVKTGGTIAPLLGKHALLRGYRVKMYTYNLEIFDPSWFQRGNQKGARDLLLHKLEVQKRFKKGRRFTEASEAFSDYLELGGDVFYHELSVDLLKKYFNQKVPLLTGLSATYLYHSQREREAAKGEMVYDDIHGEPCGHFVVLTGYDESRRHVVVADPHRGNPISHNNYYKVSSVRLINAILLGVLTYDGNLLIVEKKDA